MLSTAHCVQHSAQAVHSSPPFHSLKSSIYSTDSRVRFMCASQSTQASRIVSARACAEFWNASLRACSDRHAHALIVTQAHAAISFYPSPFDSALVLSYDGGGSDGELCVGLRALIAKVLAFPRCPCSTAERAVLLRIA